MIRTTRNSSVMTNSEVYVFKKFPKRAAGEKMWCFRRRRRKKYDVFGAAGAENFGQINFPFFGLSFFCPSVRPRYEICGVTKSIAECKRPKCYMRITIEKSYGPIFELSIPFSKNSTERTRHSLDLIPFLVASYTCLVYGKNKETRSEGFEKAAGTEDYFL